MILQLLTSTGRLHMHRSLAVRTAVVLKVVIWVLLGTCAPGCFSQSVPPPSTQPCQVPSAPQSHKVVRVQKYGDEKSHYIIIFLHGSGGPETHLDWVKQLAIHNLVLVPHYFEATSTTFASDKNYATWAQAVADIIGQERSRLSGDQEIDLVGYSLGGSIALTLATQCDVASHVVGWSASLPDYFYLHLQRVPLLLLIHGKDDAVMPFINATQMLRLCQQKRPDCEYRFFGGEGHILTPPRAHDAIEAITSFIASGSQKKGN